MQIGNVTTISVATAVWGATTKVLTSLGTAFSLVSTIRASLPASTTVTIVPTAAKAAYGAIAVVAGTNNKTDIGLSDGTSLMVAASAASNALVACPMIFMNSALQGYLKNFDGVVAATYSFVYMLLS